MRKKQPSSVFLVLLLSLFLLVGCGESPESGNPLSEQFTGGNIERVGFDIDDTLLFSTPSFERGFNADVEPFSKQFWSVVNSNDAEVSCIKPKVYKMVQEYQSQGVEVYAITAREPHNGQNLKNFLEKSYNIPSDHVFFEPDSKTDRLKNLELDIYFGDSDSDISDAQEANIPAVRIQRSKKSNYEKKYNPGKHGETIIESTGQHDCDFEPWKTSSRKISYELIPQAA